VKVSRPDEGFPEILHRLEPLIGGARPRELLVAAGEWTAYFDCLVQGTDAVSAIGHRHVPGQVGVRRPRRGPALRGGGGVQGAAGARSSEDGYVMTLEQVQQWLEITPGMAAALPG
jgi:hypothetical protein